MKFKIKAIAKYLPKNRVSSETLDIIANGVKGRIEKNTGVQFRHQISGEESVCSMGAISLQLAMSKANLKPSDLDLLIFAGASFDYPIPHNAAIIKSLITDDVVNFNCFDIDATCLSYIQALDIAQLYLTSGRYQRIAIVCAEVASIALTPEDEKVFGLFGDAAVSTIIETADGDGFSISQVYFKNFPSGVFNTYVPIGGAMNRGFAVEEKDPGYYFKMNGKGLIKLSLEKIHDFIDELETKLGYKLVDFDKIITHQTSKFGNDYFAKNFNIPAEKRVETLADYGNCISASIPLGLEYLCNNDFDWPNKKVLLLGTGAGLTIGAMALEYTV